MKKQTIVTWNVNSLKARHDYVARYLDEHRPDVLCLQELKLPNERIPHALFRDRGYRLETHGQKQYNGVAIASLLPMENVRFGFIGEEGQSRFIAARIGDIELINVYCPQGQAADSPKFAYKLRFYEALIARIATELDQTKDLILTGDLNIAPSAEDIYDPKKFAGIPSFHPKEHEAWRKLEKLGLEDVVKPFISPNTYSSWDYRKMSFRFNHGMRIDHFLVSKSIAKRISDAAIIRDFRKKKDGMTPSDHAPVQIVLM